MNSVYCRDCGKEISANALACPHCGAQQKITSNSVTEKNKIVAFLMAWFLGLLGIHKFYLGEHTQGIIIMLMGTVGWLLLFPGIIAACWAFIDGLLYLTSHQKEFDAKYNQK